MTTGLDFVAYLYRLKSWMENAFGPNRRTKGLIDHIKKELKEIEAEPDDVEEWVDLLKLAMNGALQTGATPEKIASVILHKQEKNEQRDWPDWRTADPDKAIEHVR